ncbi:MAG: ArsC/Spx/MgsR family protein [Acidimicrobiales bacterium]|nr:ArsC/Spx/MgsR family protein [Acidimicrobiales bacterium]
MAEVTIYHNPRCSKSRQAMAVADGIGTEVDEVRYLDSPPDRATLERIVDLLEDPVETLVRKGDAKKEGVELGDLTDPTAVVDLLVEHPKLMERPVLVKGGRAIIGRPTDRVEPFLNG